MTSLIIGSKALPVPTIPVLAKYKFGNVPVQCNHCIWMQRSNGKPVNHGKWTLFTLNLSIVTFTWVANIKCHLIHLSGSLYNSELRGALGDGAPGRYWCAMVRYWCAIERRWCDGYFYLYIFIQNPYLYIWVPENALSKQPEPKNETVFYSE